MKNTIRIFSLLFIFMGSLLAEGMLKISALSGEVECALAGAEWKPASLNQELNSGDKIRTKTGKAELFFAEGTTVKIKENSLLELNKIQCTEQKQNSSLKLFFGGIKAKVVKLSQGGSFDVQSPKIIAAVKGTEFALDTTNELTELQVLEGVVAITDLLKEKEFFVRENEKAAFRDGLLENPRQMDPSEINRIREGFDFSGRAAPGAGARTPGLGGADIEKEVKELRELRNDLAELKDRSNLEDKQDLLERISDVQLGKTTMDMHGYRVRTDNYVLRPEPKMLQMLNITKREGGPNAGISSFEINDTFNKNLPPNYMDVKIALKNQKGWFDKLNPPEYFLEKETAAIRNPYGDVILDEVALSNPEWNKDLTKPMWEQPFKEKFSINDKMKWRHDYNYAAATEKFTEEYFNNKIDVISDGESTGTTLPYDISKASLTSDGGILFKDTYKDGTFLEKYIYLINDAGLVQPLKDIDKGNLTWEMIYKANEFGPRTIDLIVLPAIFGELF